MTLTAAPIASAGRFSPRGPLGILSFQAAQQFVDFRSSAPKLKNEV
jgi:hypothetical protein